MRILYVAPRYHTNQRPIMKTMCEHHHEVFFFSQYAADNDDYVAVIPEIIGYSWLFNLYDTINKKWIHPNTESAINKRLIYGFPPIIKLARKLKKVNPELVIIRERSLYSIFTTLLCRCFHYKTILYNQSPLYIIPKSDIKHKIVNKLTPTIRMTPVRGELKPGMVLDSNAVFVPFVMEVEKKVEEREYLKDGVLHIFAVGKYEARKNLQMLVEAVENIEAGIPVYLTIAGEVESKENHELYKKINDHISSRHLTNIKLLSNLKREEMKEQYAECDLFVIPSTREPASISQLEAMAFSVPAICSDTNGTACYIEDGYNGYRFKDNDKKSLKECIEIFANSPNRVIEMGKNAADYLDKYCQYENYFSGLTECMKRL